MTKFDPASIEQAELRAAAQQAFRFPLRFNDRNDLARLPWFDVQDNEVVVSDPSVGPVIDVHTHFALPSFRHNDQDLQALTSDSDLLLGRCCAHHLDVYANQLFSPSELALMKRELTAGALRKRGKRTSHTAPNLARDMHSLGIINSVVLGVDTGVISRHVGMTLRTAKTRCDMIPYGSIHPRLPRRKQRFEEQVHAGARGIKIHPPLMFTRPDHPRAMPIYQWAGEQNIPVFWHCGPAGIEPKYGAYCGQVVHYEAPIRAYPNTIFVLGHSGATQSQRAIELSLRYPNVFLDVSCLSIFELRALLQVADPNRILFGSDWPFYHPILTLAKVLICTDGHPILRRKILYDNAARLLRL